MLLAGVAADVIGVDVDIAAIRHATSRYGERTNLRFVQGSCASLPLADASIELAISFETIEHISEQEAMLAELRRVLVADGILIISSPNKATYSDESGGVNDYHIRELSREELQSMLAARFPQQAWYGQRVLAHSVLWAEDVLRPRVAEVVALTGAGLQALDAPASPVYFLVVCGSNRAALPPLPALSIFDDGAQSLYRDYERALLAEKRSHWNELDARKIAEERLQQAITAVNELASACLREEALGRGISVLEAKLLETQQEHARAAAALAEVGARLRFRESWLGWLRWPLGRLRRRVQGAAAAGGRSQ